MKLVTPEDFQPWVGKAVRVNTLPHPVELTLTRVWRKPVPLMEFREPFILFFESDPSIMLIDATYEFDCGRGGPYPIYISQSVPGGGKRHYHASFN